jgi:hypothetical protein
MSRPALGLTQPSIQWVPGALSSGVKRAGREADHLPPSSVEVFRAWCLVKHRQLPVWSEQLLHMTFVPCGVALGYGLDDRGSESRQRLGIFLFTTTSRPALGPTQSPIQWVPGVLSLRVKRPGREADQSPTSSAEVKNVWSYTSASPIRLHGVVLS